MVTQTCGCASAALGAPSQQVRAASKANRKRRVIVSSVRSGGAGRRRGTISLSAAEWWPPLYLPEGGRSRRKTGVSDVPKTRLRTQPSPISFGAIGWGESVYPPRRLAFACCRPQPIGRENARGARRAPSHPPNPAVGPTIICRFQHAVGMQDDRAGVPLVSE